MRSQLTEHDLVLVDAIAKRVLELLGERETRSRLVSAAELAEVLGVSREYVYDHAGELGAERIGGGRRPRLRFNVDRARRALSARQAREESIPPESPAPREERSQRRRDPGSDVELLPVGGRRRR